MKAESAKLQAVETALKPLIADVSRAMAKTEEALARIGGKAPEPAAEIAATSLR